MGGEFKFSQNALRRESLGELGSLARFMLFKTRFDIDRIPRIDTVSRTTEHVDEMGHTGLLEILRSEASPLHSG